MPKTIDPGRLSVAARHAARIVPAARRAAGLRMPAGAHDLCRVGPRQPRLRGVPARRVGLPRRRPGRHHAAEHARLSGRVARHAARRLDRRQRQSALHAARAQGAAHGLRRHDHRHHGEFRPQARSRSSPTPTSGTSWWRGSAISCRVLKRWAFNFANSYIQHAVPAWHFDAFTMLQDACSRAPSEHYADADTQATDVALLQYTGGTTGVPKGAMLTHRNLIANTLQCLAWTGASARYAEAKRALTPLPLYHIFSLTANLLVLRGGRRLERAGHRSARSRTGSSAPSAMPTSR